MIILKDLDYKINKVEMLINLKNKQFDGEIYKAIIDVKFKFGMQCSETTPGLVKEFNQEINQEIIWTEYDIQRLLDQINDICNYSFDGDKDYLGISLLEQEFEALCFFLPDNLITLFISVGIANMGPTIKLMTRKENLKNWANEIKNAFYN